MKFSSAAFSWRDVASAAEGVAPIADADDRDGRFRRDALDVAAEVHVEHRITDHGDAPVGGGMQERDEAVSSERTRHGRSS